MLIFLKSQKRVLTGVSRKDDEFAGIEPRVQAVVKETQTDDFSFGFHFQSSILSVLLHHIMHENSEKVKLQFLN
jgi:hypothetical protein